MQTFDFSFHLCIKKTLYTKKLAPKKNIFLLFQDYFASLSLKNLGRKDIVSWG